MKKDSSLMKDSELGESNNKDCFSAFGYGSEDLSSLIRLSGG